MKNKLAHFISECQEKRLDACHSGAMLGVKGDGRLTEKFFQSLEVKAEGWAILASCKQGELSLEWEDAKHGVFTYYLINALNSEADFDNDGIISISDVARYVIENVKDWAKNITRNRIPHFH